MFVLSKKYITDHHKIKFSCHKLGRATENWAGIELQRGKMESSNILNMIDQVL